VRSSQETPDDSKHLVANGVDDVRIPGGLAHVELARRNTLLTGRPEVTPPGMRNLSTEIGTVGANFVF
jgi:hypothetical protein